MPRSGIAAPTRPSSTPSRRSPSASLACSGSVRHLRSIPSTFASVQLRHGFPAIALDLTLLLPRHSSASILPATILARILPSSGTHSPVPAARLGSFILLTGASCTPSLRALAPYLSLPPQSASAWPSPSALSPSSSPRWFTSPRSGESPLRPSSKCTQPHLYKINPCHRQRCHRPS